MKFGFDSKELEFSEESDNEIIVFGVEFFLMARIALDMSYLF
jgi:hypothetical protein